MRITSKAYAKINWALDITGRRSDGYHELDMLMQSITLHDELFFENDSQLTLTVNGKNATDDKRNLILRAADALMAYSGKRKGARIELTKRIPSQAGLGGGSSDCAVALLSLNRLWRLNVPQKVLMLLAEKLGADVPFCMETGLARVKGIGEQLTYITPGNVFPLVIVQPEEGLSTQQVFESWDNEKGRGLGLDMDSAQKALEAGDLSTFSLYADNALQETAIAILPEIWDLKEKLLQLGASFAQMSGSGSAVYGIFADAEMARQAQRELGRRALFAWTFP